MIGAIFMLPISLLPNEFSQSNPLRGIGGCRRRRRRGGVDCPFVRFNVKLPIELGKSQHNIYEYCNKFATYNVCDFFLSKSSGFIAVTAVFM